MKRVILSLALLVASGLTAANPYQAFESGVQGIILAAEYRFDPAVQRYLAEQSLAALPLKDGKLYFIFPAHGNTAQLETMQIHNLERLLDKRAAEQEQESDSD
ncbi:MAG: hypothetical protein RJQ07_11875 [Pseudomonadales bacterium]